MGGGIFGLNYNGATIKSERWINGEFFVDEYRIDKFNKVGFNLIVEDSYAVTKRHAIGLKMFIQSYSNADINSGGLLKLEYQF